MHLNKTLTIIIFLLLPYCGNGNPEKFYTNNKIKLSKKIINNIKIKLQPIDFSNFKHSRNEILYLKYYGIHFPKNNHSFGYFKSGDEKIAAHLFTVDKSKGTIFIAHGYIAHTGFYGKVIKHFLQQNFSVAIFDLPGHGLSSGRRMDINNFLQYGKVIEDFLKILPINKTESIYFIGHSTGCSAAFEYLFNFKNKFTKIIFVAPLVEPKLWNLSKIGTYILSPFISKFPRVHKKTSSNKKFNSFKKKLDLMQPEYLPFNWVRSLKKWNQKIKKYKKKNQNLFILQGDTDTNINWKFNLKFLKKKLSSVKIYIIKNGMHELLNSNDKEMEDIFNIIDNIIK